jgi:hypothetical protein
LSPAQGAKSPRVSRLVIEVSGVKLHVESDFDPALLRRVITALSTEP